jgi:hypothetical protein
MKGNTMFDNIEEVGTQQAEAVFSLSNQNETVTKSYRFDPDEAWSYHLSKFLDLLEGAGFVGVRERVAIVRTSDDQFGYDLLEGSGWYGLSVSKEETKANYVRPAPVRREPQPKEEESAEDEQQWKVNPGVAHEFMLPPDVNSGVIVEVKMRNGLNTKRVADDFNWVIDGDRGDILEYRVVGRSSNY